jgi:hypothetical protein
MSMVRILNTVSVTLLVGLAAVVPAMIIGRYIPGLFDPGIKQIVVAAWIAALASWFLARMVMSKEQAAAREAAASSSGGGSGMAIAVVFLLVAVGIAVVLHFYGTSLLP